MEVRPECALKTPRYHNTPGYVKLEYAGMYLGLAALLAIMTYKVHEMVG